jgi:upstream activation factor subunit UAF30
VRSQATRVLYLSPLKAPRIGNSCLRDCFDRKPVQRFHDSNQLLCRRNTVDFSLGSQAQRVLIARCRPRRKPPPPKTPLVNPCNPTPRWPQWSAKTHFPRTELTKKLWEYIRKHELQDPKDKRSIRADEKLLAVFDGKKIVSMFEMTKLVNGHLLKQGGL